jgi:sulfur-carrier protein
MDLTVKLFAYFRENRFSKQVRQYDPGTTVREIVVSLGIDPEEVGVIMLNSRHCDLDRRPSPGDTVAIFPEIGGG